MGHDRGKCNTNAIARLIRMPLLCTEAIPPKRDRHLENVASLIDLPPLKWSSLKYGFDHGG